VYRTVSPAKFRYQDGTRFDVDAKHAFAPIKLSIGISILIDPTAGHSRWPPVCLELLAVAPT
jgi:hypothetical protein